VQGDAAEEVCSMVTTIILRYAKENRSHEQAQSHFAIDLAVAAKQKSDSDGVACAAAICCCVSYEFRGDIQQHMAMCTVTLKVTSLTDIVKLRFLALLGRRTFIGLRYTLLINPQQTAPLVFDRQGDGGWINWGVYGVYEQAPGAKNHCVCFPNVAACTHIL
jgi:hypothetical protein